MAFSQEELNQLKSVFLATMAELGAQQTVSAEDVWTQPWPALQTEPLPKLTEPNVSGFIERVRCGLSWAGNVLADQKERREYVNGLAALDPSAWLQTEWAKNNVERDFVFYGILAGIIRYKVTEGFIPPDNPANYANMNMVTFAEAQFKEGTPSG